MVGLSTKIKIFRILSWVLTSLDGFRVSFLDFSKVPGILLGTFALALLLWASHFEKTQNITTSTQRSLIAPPMYVEHLVFGYSEVVADLMWIRAVQDFDYCERSENNVCVGRTWLYAMLDAITNLSPHFRIPYAAGGLALTVIISDIDGATKIFDKGVKAFPKDWPILYRAAYHYLYEVKDKKRAAELLIQAGHNGAPSWVFSLAGRLYTDAGAKDLAKALLQQMIEEGQDPKIIKRLQDKIQ